MEHTEGTLKNKPLIYPYEYEQASKSYLMAVVAIIAGIPLPVINLIASIGYYLAYRKSTYFVRWHCIQSVIGQALLIPFNSIAITWTVKNIYYNSERLFSNGSDNIDLDAINFFQVTSSYFFPYITFVILLNIAEFIIVIRTASRVANGNNVRWWGIARLTDMICSKKDRNPYTI